MTALAVALALLAAALLAAASVAQRSVAAEVPDEHAGGVDRAPLASWAPVGLVLVALVGACLVLAGRRRGVTRALALAAALPAVAVGEPVVAMALGIAVLSERVSADGIEWVFIGVLLIAMTVATAALARSSAVRETTGASV